MSNIKNMIDHKGNYTHPMKWQSAECIICKKYIGISEFSESETHVKHGLRLTNYWHKSCKGELST